MADNIYHLKPKTPHEKLDCLDEIMVIASNRAEALLLAKESAGDEGEDFWVREDIEITHVGYSTERAPKVLMIAKRGF